ncbi:MAG TPA: hypothetical protein VN668_02285 [Stellaceae bacterium]|nr:hypothetical protein [Stellaceae bacterium]
MTEKIIEVQVENRAQPDELRIDGSLEDVLQQIRQHAGFGGEALVFERDKDEPVGREIDGRKAVSVVVHRCHRIRVSVQFEDRTEPHDFSPAATVFRIIQWAVSKKVFNLDDTAKAKANLILPGADAPLPRDAAIGQFVSGDTCSLTVDLTLKDFTNG